MKSNFALSLVSRWREILFLFSFYNPLEFLFTLPIFMEKDWGDYCFSCLLFWESLIVLLESYKLKFWILLSLFMERESIKYFGILFQIQIHIFFFFLHHEWIYVNGVDTKFVKKSFLNSKCDFSIYSIYLLVKIFR